MHQRCTLMLRSLYAEFSPEVEIFNAKGRNQTNENERLLIVPQVICEQLNHIYEIANGLVGTVNDACRAIIEKLERTMRPFVE
jgi:hypothetical protein